MARKCLAVALLDLWCFENESGTSFMKTHVTFCDIDRAGRTNTLCADNPHFKSKIADTVFKCKWRRSVLG